MDVGMLVHLNESSVKAFFDMRAPSTMVRVRYIAVAFCGGQSRMACDNSYSTEAAAGCIGDDSSIWSSGVW
eukprot:1656656-Amphidinium_carterae.3